NDGRAYVFSGATGDLLHTLTSPNPFSGGNFGGAVAGLDDLDGDGRGDLLIGAEEEFAVVSDAGRAYVFSGATAALLHPLTSPHLWEGGRLGHAVAGLRDVSGDCRGDLAVSALRAGAPIPSGRVYVFNGATGAPLRMLPSPNPEAYGRFGDAIAGVPD